MNANAKTKIGLIILAAVIAAIGAFLWYFLPIEGCLDRGGKWDYAAESASGSQVNS